MLPAPFLYHFGTLWILVNASETFSALQHCECVGL
ncbi:hypothetical protein M2333_002407 [Sphingobium sp. B11D3B]|nr:hypothetical protein [Sphingobium sp. B12D2B]MCW2370931.1 hypothetical protein [Sphingobium sp. B11D3D]MCW2380516.1 hypothetical protein [Sphingobium sp. B2D3B]MCW2389361.1 hypothetical protein [Sphingobium sp. B11D3B]MCW2399377.1 hypothetical protein [Sphingobium sp. B2D3C]